MPHYSRVARIRDPANGLGGTRHASVRGMSAAPSARLPVLFVIDVEPDDFFVARDTTERWPGFERGVLWTEALRSQLSRDTGNAAKFCWGFRLDSQIRDAWGKADWPLTTYRDCIDSFRLHGDAIGIHTHLYRWTGDTQGWLIDQGNRDWVRSNVELSIETFRNTLGRDPAFFRFGDRWMSHEAMSWLDDAGIPFDLSLEPGLSSVPTLHRGRPHTGSIPDQRAVPRHPYRPSRADFRRPDTTGQSRIVEIPATTGRVRPTRGLGLNPSPRNAWAWLRYHAYPWFDVAGLYQDPAKLRGILDDALDRGVRHLSLTIRTDTFSKGLQNGHLQRAFDAVMSHPASSRFDWTTPEELVRRVAPGLLPAAPQAGASIHAATPTGGSSPPLTSPGSPSHRLRSAE